MEYEKIIEIISEVMGVRKEEITLKSSFYDDLGANSLDVYQIVNTLEDTFDLEISTENVQDIDTVEDAVRALKAARGLSD